MDMTPTINGTMNGSSHSKHDAVQRNAPARPPSSSKQRHWFSLPEPVRRVFDSFPLLTIADNRLPQRATIKRRQHILYIFATKKDTARSNLSCNPTCLKWQTYLIINNIDFCVQASNNHASPSGSLPFLLPEQSTPSTQAPPIASSKIQRWALAQVGESDLAQDRFAIYQALVDQNIRNAWLYYLYLDRSNFDRVATPLYITSATSNPIVQWVIATQLRSAAQEELLKSRQTIDEDDICFAADKAFASLSTVLGSREFFGNNSKPDLFDASLFAYTHLLLDKNLQWENMALQNALKKYHNLLLHRDRIQKLCLQS